MCGRRGLYVQQRKGIHSDDSPDKLLAGKDEFQSSASLSLSEVWQDCVKIAKCQVRWSWSECNMSSGEPQACSQLDQIIINITVWKHLNFRSVYCCQFPQRHESDKGSVLSSSSLFHLALVFGLLVKVCIILIISIIA